MDVAVITDLAPKFIQTLLRSRLIAALFAALLLWPATGGAGAPEAASNLPVEPLWRVSESWQSDTGTILTHAELTGRPTLVAMFFTGCHVKCPATVATMQWLEHHLPPALAERCRFVLVTLDPTGDTVAILHDFRIENGLSPQWLLVRGARRDTHDFADRIGLAFQVGPYRTTHSSKLLVLDTRGKPVSQYTELYPDLTNLTKALQQAGLSYPDPSLQARTVVSDSQPAAFEID